MHSPRLQRYVCTRLYARHDADSCSSLPITARRYSTLCCVALRLLRLSHLQPKAAPCTGDSGIPRRACRATQRVHTVFQVRFRLIRLPVVRKPLSPIAPRHSIDNWPNVARPSFRKSFCRASSPSVRFPSCSTRNATCSTSRGLSVGGPASGTSDVESQFSETDLNGGFGFSLVCWGH